MTDERLAQIRARLGKVPRIRWADVVLSRRDIRDLLAEVERLSAVAAAAGNLAQMVLDEGPWGVEPELIDAAMALWRDTHTAEAKA